jgi:hypothetical protein
VTPNGPGQSDPFHQSQNRDDYGNESELSKLHTNIERKKRQRHIARRQPDIRQRIGKTKTMQQAEGERDNPRIPFGQPQITWPFLFRFSIGFTSSVQITQAGATAGDSTFFQADFRLILFNLLHRLLFISGLVLEV